LLVFALPYLEGEDRSGLYVFRLSDESNSASIPGRKEPLNDLRIACFLPAASEMVCDLGLIDQLVGVSHECDYPAAVKTKPVVVRCAMDLASLNLKQIDEAVSARVGQGQSVYAVDEEAIKKVKPTLIITQDLCQVCAPSGNEATQALKSLVPKPEFLWQTPHSFENVLTDLIALGEKTGTLDKAKQLAAQAAARVEAVKAKTQGLVPTKVFFMEWVDPIYCGGHWMPEMLGWAGGVDNISKPNVDSIRIAWEDILKWDPEVLIVSPCGYNTAKSLEQAEQLKARPGWSGLKAVKNKRVYAVDGNSYFARPALRLVDGVELLAHLIHPEIFDWKGVPDAFTAVSL
jgi:iron complex transport system substrate-binding protein